MNILNVGECNSHNLGDKLIAVCTKKIIESECPTTKVTQFDLTQATNYIESKNSDKKLISQNFIRRLIPSKIKWILSRSVKVYKKLKSDTYDCLLIGGGQLILGNNVFPVAILIYVIFFKFLNGKKILLFNVGCASDFKFLDKILIKFYLKYVDEVYLRDECSYANFVKHFKHDFVIKSIDPVFYASEFFEFSNDKLGRAVVFPASYEAVYLKYNTELSYNQYVSDWVARVENQFHNQDIVVACSDQSQDKIISVDVYTKLISNGKLKSVRYVNVDDYREMLELIANSESILSARMHPLIVAKSFNIPKILVYTVSNKLIGFQKEFVENEICIKDRLDLVRKSFRVL